MDALWKCDICAATFQRLDYLKRHSATHTMDRPFMCDFCGSLYKRGDILRRHWKSCSARIHSGQAMPEPRLGGKEKHACDGCARLKRSCTGGQPCSECLSRGRDCSYQRLGDDNMASPSAYDGAVSQGCDGGQLQSGYAAILHHQPDSTHPTWDLGPQTFYPSGIVCYQAYGRRNL